MKRSKSNVRGRHGYDKTGLGLWATLGPDRDYEGKPKKQSNHLRINGGSSTTKNDAKTVESLTMDPVDFLLSLEKRNINTSTYKSASLVPLQSSNSPSIRKIHSIEKEKWLQQKSYEKSMMPLESAHDNPKSFEKTSLGLYATLPVKDHGPEFEKK
jgi:hypothetical protein